MTAPGADDERVVHTFCRYCAAACGITVTVRDERVQKIGADKLNPHSWRDFCAKGRTAHHLVEHPRRIVSPMRRVGERYVPASWDEALTDIAHRMNAATEESGRDAIGVYYGNPAGFSSSNLVFMNGWLDGIGTQNRYAVGSIDQNNVHVVAEAMYGSPLLVPVSDVDECDYFLIVGANPAVSAWNWVESVPAGWARALARQRDGARIVVVDPVRTASAKKADTHLAVRPGQDWALLLAMVTIILEEDLHHEKDCEARVSGMDALRALTTDADVDDLASRCDIPVETIRRVAVDFATARTAMVVTRTGVSLQEAGTVAEWLGQVLNVITGRMDRPGGRRFERGYVDTVRLAALAEGKSHRSRLAGREQIAGAHSLSELPDEITTPGQGQIRAMVINCGNPVVSGPDGARLDAALADLDLLVAIDFVQRESHRHAHWLLPAVHWLERDDLPVFTSGLHDEPYAQYGRRAVAPPTGAREEWRFFLDLSLAMNTPMFGVRGLNGFIRATRLFAGVLRRPGIAFGPQWINRLVVATSRKIDGRRITWKMLLDNEHGVVLGPREYGHLRSALRTPDKRIRLAPDEFVRRTEYLLTTPIPAASEVHPFVLGNQRRRHSMNSWLNELDGLHPGGRRNDVVINTDDAARLGIADGDRVRVYSAVGEVEVSATISDEPRRGVILLDHGWGSRVFDPTGDREPDSFGVNRNLLVDRAAVDPLSQTSALNGQYVGMSRVETRRQM